MPDAPAICVACGSDAGPPLLEWTPPHRIHLCRTCGLVFARPLPTDEALDRFYQGFAYRRPRVEQVAEQVEARKREFQRAGFADRARTAGCRLLDFGGGTGVATLAARELGFDAFLQEVDEQAIRFVVDELGLPADRVLRVLDAEAGAFDIIFCDNVIEHVKDPEALLRLLLRHLRPGGELHVKTPHARNTDALFFPAVNLRGYLLQSRKKGNRPARCAAAWLRRFWHCEPPRHLYSFSADSLRRLLERADEGGRADPSIRHYWVPLWEYSLSHRERDLLREAGVGGYARRHLRGLVGSRGGASLLYRWSLPLLLPAEAASKLLQWSLRRLRLLSPGGVTLVVRRPAEHPAPAAATPGG